ncbi:hypothetical protein GMPD_41110 [Geomonas paludis]|uniref:Uncharacterized protein n=1 Tax=Geomonas paludis TaxID=2740185 RepID=A0A6V8N172_9BACT|nr:hypothetical protein GMPD_41110 [Geomonas paludis]
MHFGNKFLLVFLIQAPSSFLLVYGYETPPKSGSCGTYIFAQHLQVSVGRPEAFKPGKQIKTEIETEET